MTASLASGHIVTATDLNRLQPTPYSATQTADVSGAVTDADLTGCTKTFDTETNNATYKAWANADFDHSGATTTVATAALNIDGVKQAGEITYQQGVSTDRMSPGRVWTGTLAAAGTHTMKLTATLPAGIQIHQTNTTLMIEITEVVS